MSSISKQSSKPSSWKGLLATLAVLATAGVYCELESGPDGVAEEARPSASIAVEETRDSRSERAAADLAEPRSALEPRRVDLASPSDPTQTEASSSRARREEARAASEKPDGDSSEDPSDDPREDPVAQATKAFAARLEAEPFDAKWAPVAEGLLAEHFPAEGGRTLTAAKCRSSVCRIELAFESEAARDDELGSLTLPWDSVGVFQLDEADSLTLVIYATREPEDLSPRG
jgi:hypothetical protein